MRPVLTPCDAAGTYGTKTASVSVDDCADCPAGTFAGSEGDTGCTPCVGALSWSQPRAEACWPGLVSVVVADPPPVDPGLSAGDTVTLTFSAPTNAPVVGTTEQVLAIVNFSTPVGVRFTGRWSHDATSLVVTIAEVGVQVAAAAAESSQHEIGQLRVSVASESPLRDQSGKSAPYDPTGVAPLVATGSWGTPHAPRIVLATAVNGGQQVGLGVGDWLELEFDQRVSGGPSANMLKTKVRALVIVRRVVSYADTFCGW